MDVSFLIKVNIFVGYRRSEHWNDSQGVLLKNHTCKAHCKTYTFICNISKSSCCQTRISQVVPTPTSTPLILTAKLVVMRKVRLWWQNWHLPHETLSLAIHQNSLDLLVNRKLDPELGQLVRGSHVHRLSQRDSLLRINGLLHSIGVVQNETRWRNASIPGKSVSCVVPGTENIQRYYVSPAHNFITFGFTMGRGSTLRV